MSKFNEQIFQVGDMVTAINSTGTEHLICGENYCITEIRFCDYLNENKLILSGLSSFWYSPSRFILIKNE